MQLQEQRCNKRSVTSAADQYFSLTDEHTPPLPLEDLERKVIETDNNIEWMNERTVIDNERNVRNFWCFDLDVVNDQDLGGRLPHDNGR